MHSAGLDFSSGGQGITEFWNVVPCRKRNNHLHATLWLLSQGVILLCALGTDFKGNDQWETRHWSRRDEMLWGQKDAAVIRNTWLLGSARVQETTCVLPTTYMYIWNIIWIKRLSSLYEIRAFCTFSLTLLLTPFAVCKSGCICSCHCEWFYNGLQLTLVVLWELTITWQKNIQRRVDGLMYSVILHCKCICCAAVKRDPLLLFGSIPYFLVSFDSAKKLPTLLLYWE